MKAMILAAGLGTRLRPLTEGRPKVLMPVVNRPVIARTIDYLRSYGVGPIIINAHHHCRQIVDFFHSGRPVLTGVDVRIEPEILGTGGGIRNTEDFWDEEPFIVINGDILTDIDLGRAYEDHRRSGDLITLVLHDYGPFNQIRIDENLKVIDISEERRPGRQAFTGIHIMDRRFLSFIPDKGFSDIISCYRQWLLQGEMINACLSEGHYWRDIGSLGSYVAANKELLDQRRTALGPGCRVDADVQFREWAVVGENARLEEGVEISRSILWDHVRIHRGLRIVDSVVTSHKEVTRDLTGEIY